MRYLWILPVIVIGKESTSFQRRGILWRAMRPRQACARTWGESATPSWSLTQALGLADRVAALGGAFALDSPAGAGTTIRAELPCAL